MKDAPPGSTSQLRFATPSFPLRVSAAAGVSLKPPPMGAPAASPRQYLYRWDRCGRKGQRCYVFARGTMNSVGLVFDDGFRMITSGNALRRA
ncbi:hypothetical protein ASE61_00745 [Bosea sp. Root670]|uniref:hypothetical protein n=1 Tax=Bosea sp. Root670 TaxID=1736583 RepID=UPI0007145E8C|nr:hypothetical protein [Bosea sp. Root670]KRE08179.1 hypothetical protein ASE61_00745 [Bosea sp. Root670]